MWTFAFCVFVGLVGALVRIASAAPAGCLQPHLVARPNAQCGIALQLNFDWEWMGMDGDGIIDRSTYTFIF